MSKAFVVGQLQASFGASDGVTYVELECLF